MKWSAMVLLMVFAVSSFAGTVTIVNDLGGWDIWYVQISSSDAETWGDDWLGSDEILFDGTSKTFNVRDGLYDIRLEDEDGDEYIQYFVDVAGSYTWVVTLDDLGEYYSAPEDRGLSEETVYGSTPITIYNNTGDYEFWYIYANPVSYMWGDDRLGSEILYPGEEYTFYVEGDLEYDIYCEDVDGDTYTFWGEWVGRDGLYLSVGLEHLD